MKYKVLGGDSDQYQHFTHIPGTCQHVIFSQPNVRGEAKSAISEATPLLSTATPPRLRHIPVPIVLHTQRPSFEPCLSASLVAHGPRPDGLQAGAAAHTRRE